MIVPSGWEETFLSSADELTHIINLLDERRKKGKLVLPPPCKIFAAFEAVPLSKVRVVIIGQDPYHSFENGQPVAIGKSFATHSNNSVPPSLRNIFKEISNEFGKPPSASTDLSLWESQGVLLLNSCLTVDSGEAGSHSRFDIWRGFIDQVFISIGKVRPHCIYLLWGKDASKLKTRLVTRKFNKQEMILEAAHPSPFSASRGFFECGHFVKVNEFLTMMGEEPIIW